MFSYAFFQSITSKTRTWTVIGIITVLCFLVNFPHFFTYQPVTDDLMQEADDRSPYLHTEFGSGYLTHLYEFWIHCMLLVQIPWVTILTLNILIIRKVRKVHSRVGMVTSNHGNKTTAQARYQMTKLLITVSFAFLALYALRCVTECLFNLLPESVRHFQTHSHWF